MHHDIRNALLAATACTLWLGTTAPAAAATTFVSAEATVFAEAKTTYAQFPPPAMTRSDFSSTARRLAAEARVQAGVALEDFSGATVGALADFAADGSQGLLSVGYENYAANYAPISQGFATAEVRYSFLYRFEVDTVSRFIGDWTVGFPQDVTIALAGPSVLDGPLPAAFGSHSVLLRPGSYELTSSARDFILDEGPGYYIGQGLPRLSETRGFDIYSFLIFETAPPPIPEPGTASLAALGAGVLGIAVSRRRRGDAASRLAHPGSGSPTPCSA